MSQNESMRSGSSTTGEASFGGEPLRCATVAPMPAPAPLTTPV
ncbi:hypothetical protein ACFCWV_13710 [Streptomyces sp. NPDC056341]